MNFANLFLLREVYASEKLAGNMQGVSFEQFLVRYFVSKSKRRGKK